MTSRAHRIAILLTGAVIALPVTGAAQNTAPVVVRGEVGGRTSSDSVYSEMQVEKTVLPLPGPRPAYPAALSAAHIQGKVLVQFVVDTLGRPEVATLKVIETSNPLFADAVRDALPAMRFTPAELHGHVVRQLVMQPFVFTLD